MANNKRQNPETLALHHGYNPLETSHKSIQVPLHVNTAYAFDSTQQAKDIFELREGGFLYTRLNNPTTGVLEERLAAIDGGVAGIATSCGQSAVATALLTLLNSGDHIVASSSIYGGTFNLLNTTLPRFGITTTFVDLSDPSAIEAKIQENTKVVFCETLGNPKLDFTDIRAVSEVAHRHQLPLFVDNTITSGLYRPIEDGADVVLYALTKYVCGNGTTMGGAIIDSGNYDWGGGKFPAFTEPNASYHGIKYAEAFGPAAYIARIRVEGLRDLGACISPFNAFQLIQGLETLHARMEVLSARTLDLAQWLESHPLVEWVNYPGLSSHPAYERCKEKLNGKYGALLTFGPKGGYEVARKVGELTKIFKIVANLGDSRSLIIHPSSTTHNQLTPEEQAGAGISPELIRLAIGFENIEDIKADLDQALRAASK